MPCCCSRDKNDGYDGVQTAPMRNGAPRSQSMSRAGAVSESDSDYRAVKWMRSRTSDSSKQHVELSASEMRSWKQAGTTSSTHNERKMATIESIEVDDISALRASKSSIGCAETTTSTEPSLDTPKSHLERPEPDEGDAKPPPSPPRPNKVDPDGADELDAIVLALEKMERSRRDESPPRARRPSSSPRSSSRGKRTNRSPSPFRSSPSQSVRRSPGQSSQSGRRGSRSPPGHHAGPFREGRLSLGEPPQPFPDALSDVPSDVDSDTKERYLTACRLLKATMLDRETRLMPGERTFLQGLLEQAEDTLSEAHVSAVETASQILLSDPLFQDEPESSSSLVGDLPLFPRDRVRYSWQERAHEKAQENARMLMDFAARMKDRTTELPALMDDETQTDTGTEIAAASVTRFDGHDVPFYIMNVAPNFEVGVLTPSLMEALRSFFPTAVSQENFWLKFSLHRDGASLPTLLSNIRTSKHTILGVETTDGHVFGAFCSSPWRVQTSWFGSVDCFLWRLKHSRLIEGESKRNFDYDSEMEVYPYTGKDSLIQYCTKKTMAVGGGDWTDDDVCPYTGEPRGIGLMVDGDLLGGETNACATFANPRLCSRLSSKNEFDIRALEVWTVTPCSTIEEAEKLEMHRLFVEEQTR